MIHKACFPRFQVCKDTNFDVMNNFSKVNSGEVFNNLGFKRRFKTGEDLILILVIKKFMSSTLKFVKIQKHNCFLCLQGKTYESIL